MNHNGFLKIAIIGVGGIGSAFAFQLAKIGKHDVTVIARPQSKRWTELARDQGIVDSNGERAAISVSETLDESISYDLILVTLKAHQVEAVLPALQKSAAVKIQFMFNCFEPEVLQAAVGATRSIFGMPFIQAHIDESGKLHSTIGAGGQKCLMDNVGTAAVFTAAGLPSKFEPKMLLWLRSHTPMCIAFETSSFWAVERNGGATWTQASLLASGVKESFTLIERLGYEIYPGGKKMLWRSPNWALAGIFWALSRVKSFRDLLATGIDEARALVSVLLAASERANPPIDRQKISAMKG